MEAAISRSPLRLHVHALLRLPKGQFVETVKVFAMSTREARGLQQLKSVFKEDLFNGENVLSSNQKIHVSG